LSQTRHRVRLELQRQGEQLRLQLGQSVITCSCPSALAETQLEDGLAALGLRVFRETNPSAGRATLTGYRFSALPEASAQAFQRFQRAAEDFRAGRSSEAPDASEVLESAFRKVEILPGWDDPSTPVWVAVFETATLTRTGVELLLVDERDADYVLPYLAQAWGRERQEIEIKPPGSWGWGYEAYRPRP
jgi:hypothetical protein